MPHSRFQAARGGAAMKKRIVADQCCGVIVDVQEFFLMQLDGRQRGAIEANTANLVRLFGYFRIPMIATLERPLDTKGRLPDQIDECLADLPHALTTRSANAFFSPT